METWRLLAWVCVMLVLWVGLMAVLGRQPTLVELLTAPLFAVVGLYLGEWLSDRLTARRDG